jgi:DtxR family Mn-dependent transcriptional regulator
MPNPLTALLVGIFFLGFFSLLFWPNGGLIGYFSRVKRYSNRILHEDALKHLQKNERHGTNSTLESIAGALSISTSQAANLMEEIQVQGLVEIKGENFQLTSAGRDYALKIIRAHRLWERYLAEETGFAESEWHDLAERYEHELSPQQADRLSSRLGNPTHDPHGDPIPTADGAMVLHGGEPLPEMPLGDLLRIVHIEDEPEVVYAQLVAEGLHPGMEVQLTESSERRVRFWTNGNEHVLAPIVAASISVVPVPQEERETPQPGEPLLSLKPGSQGRVVALSPRLRGAERRRIMDLGILPGTIVRVEMTSPGGDPTAYRIRGALIALREEQSNLIRIEKIQETGA